MLPLLLTAGALAGPTAAVLTGNGSSGSTRAGGTTQISVDLAGAERSAGDGMDGMDGMEGMDHGSAGNGHADHGNAATSIPAATPDPTPSTQTPSTQTPSTQTPSTQTPSTEMATDMPGMPGMDGGTAETEPDRPLGPVLATFGAGNAMVLLGAVILRRRDRIARLAKANRRTGKGRS